MYVFSIVLFSARPSLPQIAMGTLLGFENKIQAKNREAKRRSSAGDGVRLERRARRELLLRLGTWTRREGDGPRRPVHEGGRAVDTDLQVELRLRIGGVRTTGGVVVVTPFATLRFDLTLVGTTAAASS